MNSTFGTLRKTKGIKARCCDCGRFLKVGMGREGLFVYPCTKCTWDQPKMPKQVRFIKGNKILGQFSYPNGEVTQG